MTDPITPPQELIERWLAAPVYSTGGRCTLISLTSNRLSTIVTKAAQWGADQELEACREWLWLNTVLPHTVEALYAARRPNPLSTIKIAEEMIARHNDGWTPSPSDWVIIRDALADGRRALEALDD